MRSILLISAEALDLEEEVQKLTTLLATFLEPFIN